MKTHREAGGAWVHGAGMIAGCISYHPLHHHPAKTAPTNFLHWNSDEERREGHHQQKRNQQTPSLLNSWMNYDQTMDNTLHNGTKSNLSQLSVWKKRYDDEQVLLWSKLLLTVERGAAKLVNLSKLVAIMHACAPMSVLVGGWDDHLVGQLTGCHHACARRLRVCPWGRRLNLRKRGLRRTKTSKMPEKINFVISWWELKN